MSKSVFAQVAKDATKEKKGVWQPLACVDELEVCVRRNDNPDAQKTAQRLWKPHRRRIDRGTMDPAESARITREITAKSIFIEFRGPAAIDEDGTPLENTEANRQRLLEHAEIFEEVAALSQDLSLFRAESLEEDAGN